jgi:hypothetical protein
VAGPLDHVEGELRRSIEATLSLYAHALESGDSELLAEARPDLGPDARERRLRPYRGALNAAADLRVIDVRVTGPRAEVELLATDVVVGGDAPAPQSVAETLVFERAAGGWALRGR